MNITAEQRLALARAVYPESRWEVGSHGHILGTAEFCDDGLFSPESDPAQLLDVLCWLLSHDFCNTLRSDGILYFLPHQGGSMSVFREHNCTPASLSDAIVRAAVRVMEGE